MRIAATFGMNRVEQRLDVAALDAHLEALLDLDADARQRRLDELEREAPELVPVLRKLLRVAAEVDTVELRGVGGALELVEDERPPPPIEGYRITGEIGRGGMAIVYAALRDVHGSEQPVAIKLLRAALGDGSERDRFLTEQRILARLQHPHIAQLIEVGSIDERPYMVLEQISGVPIDPHWQAGVVPVATVLDAAMAIADALHHAHRHFVVHRDVKPENVPVDSEGRIKLIDFGIAKLLPASTLLGAVRTATGAVPLTLRYASPEQLLGRPVGVASDLYQLGLLLYHLLTAAWPYDEQPGELPLQRLSRNQVPALPSRRVAERKRQRQLHGDLDSILLRCLAWNPEDRYPSVLAFRQLAMDIHGGDSRALTGPLETLSWTLFELGHLDAAARVAAKLLPRDAAIAPRAATVLELAQALGVDAGLHPDAWAQAQGNACDQAERTALRGFLVNGGARQQGTVPPECSASRAARLAPLGWQWSTKALLPLTPEPFDGALARAARTGAKPQWPQALETEQTARVDTLLSQL